MSVLQMTGEYILWLSDNTCIICCQTAMTYNVSPHSHLSSPEGSSWSQNIEIKLFKPLRCLLLKCLSQKAERGPPATTMDVPVTLRKCPAFSPFMAEARQPITSFGSISLLRILRSATPRALHCRTHRIASHIIWTTKVMSWLCGIDNS